MLIIVTATKQVIILDSDWGHLVVIAAVIWLQLILELCRSEDTADLEIIQPHLDRMQNLRSLWNVEVSLKLHSLNRTSGVFSIFRFFLPFWLVLFDPNACFYLL